MCDAIYTFNTQQAFKKIKYGRFSNILHLLKNGGKSGSFAAPFEQHLKSTMSRKYLRKCMTFKLVNQLKSIGAMKIFTKPYCNLCVEKCLTILKS